MSTKLTKKLNYSPYNIFERNSPLNNRTSTNNKLPIFNSFELPPKHKKIVIDISKNLKSVAISNKLFSNYMENYNNLTQDFCFKSPDNSSYPIRKNFRYLSAGTIKNAKQSYKTGPRKIIRKPISVNTFKKQEINNRINNNKKYFINYTNKRNSKNNDLLLSLSEGVYNKKCNFGNSENNNINNNNIDLDNNKNLKQQHFEFLKKYIKNNLSINSNEMFDKTKLSLENILTKMNIKYELNVYSLCLKFRELNSDKKIKQKLYIKFKYLPIFYLLDYQLFKLFLSEIIYYDTKSNTFLFINDKFDEIINKYCKYINSFLNDSKANINDITFFKKEFSFPLLYKWFIYNKNNINNEENNKKTMIFELKIELPKIKFKIIDFETKIKNNLKKSLMIQLMKSNFIKWEELILFELFFIKRFRYIINSILVNNNKYFHQKIDLCSYYIKKNEEEKNSEIRHIEKNFEFFISEINECYSNYYIFNPYIIILNRRKNKYYQEIHLTFRESKILYKFGKYWGIKNTLLKCIDFHNESNNKVTFNFDILENISSHYLKTAENKKNEKKEQQNKFRFNKIDITIEDCSLKKLIIKNSEKKEKFIAVPKNFLKLILSFKEKIKNKIFSNIAIINEYCKEIREEKNIFIKQNIKKLYDKEYDNSDLLYESNSKINNSKKNNIINLKENEYKKINNKNKIKIKEFSSEKEINQNKRNTNIFLTKYKNNEEEDIIKKNIENNYMSFINNNYNYRKTLKNNTLYYISNKKDLAKNRTVRDSFAINNEIETHQFQNPFIDIRKKRANTFKKYK